MSPTIAIARSAENAALGAEAGRGSGGALVAHARATPASTTAQNVHHLGIVAPRTLAQP
jgi:hypothetical protein